MQRLILNLKSVILGTLVLGSTHWVAPIPFGQYASGGILYFFPLLTFIQENFFASCSKYVTWLASHKRYEIWVYFLEPLLEIPPVNLPFQIFPILTEFNLTNSGQLERGT